jgi:DNA replication protein DnaC
MDPISIVTVTCACGADFQTVAFRQFPDLHGELCDECLARAEEESAEKQRMQKEQTRRERAAEFQAEVDTRTPERLRATNLDHPEFNLVLWEKVSAWDWSSEKPWLGLVGETGSSKSRIAYLTLRDFARSRGERGDKEFSFAVVSGPLFNRLVLSQFSKDTSEEAARELRALRNAHVLLFDELGKVRPTPAIIDELFALIDCRHSRNDVTLWTSNTEPEVFCAGWPAEFAHPGAGRIIEASTIFKA